MKDKSTVYRIFTIFNIIFLTLVGAVMLYPYLNVMAVAFNDAQDSMAGGITILPRVFTLDNFKQILRSDYIMSAFILSVVRVAAGVVIGVAVQFAAAYVLTKKDLPGRRFLLMLLTVPMFLTGGVIANYVLYSKIGFLNNFWVYILPGAFSFYNMIIIKAYMSTIPESLIESAELDGAPEFVVLFRIIFPLSLPILATIALWVAVAHWNDYSTTLYYITKSKYFTLQYILMQMVKDGERVAKLVQDAAQNGQTVEVKSTPEALKAAQIIVTTIPIICVYPFLQKYFVKGILVGSVKG